MVDDRPSFAPAEVPAEGAMAKWDGCEANDPYCEVALEGDDVDWTVTFEGFSYDPVVDRTTFVYDITMPTGASQSGKVAMEIPTCCTWSGTDFSDGNKNDNAASDVEFNTTDFGVTTVNYVFEGDLYIAPISVGLKVNSNTNPATKLIYGPAPWPVYTFTGHVFEDLPEGTSESEGPDGVFDIGEPALSAVVTIETPNNELVDVTTVDGVYSYTGRQGLYQVSLLDTKNPGLFNVNDYLTTTNMTGSALIGPDGPGPDFGFMESFDLSGGVFLDQPLSNGDSGNGSWDTGEPGISGIEIGLYQGTTLKQSTFTLADGTFLFEGLGWEAYDVRLVKAGANAGLFTSAFTPTLSGDVGYFSLFSGLVNGHKSGAYVGFEVATAKAAQALEDGLALTNGLPREYWKVQISGKGSPKYKPEIDFATVQGYLDMMDSFRDGGLPAGLGLSGLSLDTALQVVKTENNNDIYEALRTEIFVALLNWAAGKGTVTIDGEAFETRFFIEHGITVLMGTGYPNPGAGKISSGSVSEGERLLEETNGG